MTIRDLQAVSMFRCCQISVRVWCWPKRSAPDMRDDVHAIRRALDLACLRTWRAKDRTATGPLGRWAAILILTIVWGDDRMDIKQ